MTNARAARTIQAQTIRNARPIVRAMLTTTAIAWSLGIQLPETAPRRTVLAQSIGVSAPDPAAATQASSRLLALSQPSVEAASPRA